MEFWERCKSVRRRVYILSLGCLALPFLILFLCLSVPILIFRYTISILSKYLRPDLAEIVSSVGHFFAVEDMTEQSSRCVIALTIFFEGNLTLEQVQELWFSRVVNARHADRLKYPELQQYITTFAFFKFWKIDPFFDVRNHIKHYQFPRVVKTLSFEELNLQEIHEHLHNKPFPSKRSPWEVILVGNFRHCSEAVAGNNETASVGLEITSESKEKPLTLVAFRFHHCLADGYSIQKVFVESMLDKNVNELQRPRPSFFAGSNDKRKSCEKLLSSLFIPFSMFYEACHFLELGLQRNVPWIVKEGDKMWQQVVGFTPVISINCIRDIKNFHNVSFTSVLVSAITGAIRKLLITKSQIEALKELTMPIVFALPLKNHPSKLRNHFTFGFMNIPIDENDQLVRLNRCHKIVERAKRSAAPLFGKCMMILTGSMFHSIVKLITINRVIPIIISNFPVSGVQLGLPGHDCLEICGSAGPARGAAGALFAVTTYGKDVRFSVTAEEAVLSQEEVNQLTAYIREEITILHNELL